MDQKLFNGHLMKMYTTFSNMAHKLDLSVVSFLSLKAENNLHEPRFRAP